MSSRLIKENSLIANNYSAFQVDEAQKLENYFVYKKSNFDKKKKNF